MDAKDIIGHLEEDRLLKERRKEEYFKKHPYDNNHDFNENEDKYRRLSVLLEYFMNWLFEDRKYRGMNIEDTMIAIKEDIEEDGGISYDNILSIYNKLSGSFGRIDFTEEEEDCVLEYAYKLLLKEEKERRNEIQELLDEIMPWEFASDIIANYCI